MQTSLVHAACEGSIESRRLSDYVEMFRLHPRCVHLNPNPYSHTEAVIGRAFCSSIHHADRKVS